MDLNSAYDSVRNSVRASGEDSRIEINQRGLIDKVRESQIRFLNLLAY